MPIEIRELIIKTTITENAPEANQKNGVSRHELEKIKTEIMDFCLEKIDEKIGRRKDR